MNPKFTSAALVEPSTVAYEVKDGSVSSFNVPAGVPLGRAFDDLSVLLSSARDAMLSEVINDPSAEPSSRWSALHNLQLSYALLQAMHKGYLAHRTVVEGKV